MFGPLSRRTFLEACATGSASAVFLPAAFARQQAAHRISARKSLPRAWPADLLADKSSRVLEKDREANVAMPVCGIGTGQLYLLPDGRLETWDIFNEHRFSGYGRDAYGRTVAKAGVAQGFSIIMAGEERPLTAVGFAKTRFRGRYPIGRVEYEDARYPIAVTLEAFSPFVPLDARSSALPATVFAITLKNKTGRRLEGSLRSWLENCVCRRSAERFEGIKVEQMRPMGSTKTMGAVMRAMPLQEEARSLRPTIRFDDFEREDWGEWVASGAAFTGGPARGTLPSQQDVSGFSKRRLVNSFREGDDSTGVLRSKTFKIERHFVNLRVGGGKHAGKTEVVLLVGGKPVRVARGENSERLSWRVWKVADLEGKEARIEIRDHAKGNWGHILCDDIEFSDTPRAEGTLAAQGDFAELSLVGSEQPKSVALGGKARTQDVTPQDRAEHALDASPTTSLYHSFELDPGGSTTLRLVLAWYAPNHPFGRHYATFFHGAEQVAGFVLDNLEWLEGKTRKFVATYYDSTLPEWLLDRILFPVSNLATSLVQWRGSGRFWAWEGVGCCAGTCTHVWNYAQAMGALFPELERNVREYQDFGEGFDEKTGLVGFRSNRAYAADGQCGTILKAYREHLHSGDMAFLHRNWPRIRMAMLYLVKRDANDDGLIEDSQHNTYDINFHGPNTFVGALYLAALRAAARMAGLVGDDALAARLTRIAERGSANTMKRLWNGDYFVQEVDLKKYPKAQYADGCLSDQLFGQNWAHQLGLGYLYPKDAVRTALASIYKYNWSTDVWTYNEKHAPERVFAVKGEPGLFTCTWPKSEYLARGVRYKSEIWTGIEHQVASHMLFEGMTEQGLHLIRGIDDRYSGRKNNPYNEVECGDHYARSLASWANLTGLMGFGLDGPAGIYCFDPRVQRDDFRAFFVGPAGWGSYSQKGEAKSRVHAVQVEHGELRIRELVLRLAASRKVHCELRDDPREPGTSVSFRVSPEEDGRTRLTFDSPITLEADRQKTLRIF